MKHALVLSFVTTLLLGTVPSAFAGHLKDGDTPTLAFESATGHGQITLEQYRGKIVLVDFWATWCPACTKLTPDIKAIEKQYGDNLAIIGISLDTEKQSLLDYCTKNDLKFPQYFDGLGRKNKILNQWAQGEGWPRFLILDPQGTLRYQGGREVLEKLKEAFEKYPPKN